MPSDADKEDLRQALRDEGRQRLGPPPSAEEVEALYEGRLAESEATRVRELLIYYPEIARLMTDSFPLDSEAVLTEAQLGEDRARLRKRLFGAQAEPPQAPVMPMPRRTPRYVAAAVIGAVLIGGTIATTYLYEHSDLPYRHATSMMLRPDGQLGATRGSSQQTPHQLTTNTAYRLKPLFRPEHEYRRYDLELFDVSADSPRSVWKRRNVKRASDGSFSTPISTKHFAPGRYELVLFGVDDQPVRLAIYSIRLTKP